MKLILSIKHACDTDRVVLIECVVERCTHGPTTNWGDKEENQFSSFTFQMFYIPALQFDVDHVYMHTIV